MKIRQCAVLFLSGIFLCSFSITAVQAEDFGKALLRELLKKPEDKQNADTANSQQQNTQQQPTAQASQPQPKQIVYSGYSQAFLPAKTMFACGKASEAAALCNPKALKAAQAATNKTASSKTEPVRANELSSEVLANLEGGNIALCSGNVDQAIDRFSGAENVFAKSESTTKVGGWLKKTTIFAMESMLGNEELGDYNGEGYERVLMLNLKSIAYLLAGQREAYNVTRRSIDWQENEKKRFAEKIQSAKKELAAKERGQSRNTTSGLGLTQMLAKDYAPMETKATTVPSAYVNPFGYYVAGMVQEFESFNDPSLRDNACISYKKALEFNPGSKVLREIVADIKTPPPLGKRLVHVVAEDGFVPEKKLLKTGIKTEKSVVPVKLPIYVPVPSQVSRIEVADMKGKKLATLSTVADVEAICLRNQMDGAVLREFKLFMAILRSSVEQGVSDGLGEFGKIFSNVRDQMTTPDMRSWMSLPATVQAARFYIPAGTDKIKIATYDASGNKLASSIVSLDTSSHNFISVRSIDRTLYVQANKKMWFAKN
jgi:uncharacterized protein